MRLNYWKALLVLLMLTLILGACSSLASPASAPVIPGLAQTLAAETLSALNIHQAPASSPVPPGYAPESIKVFDNLLTPTPQMAEPNAALEEQVTPIPEGEEPQATPRCSNIAEFVRDVTIPDDTRVDPGQRFVKTWEFKNAGTCTWTPEYSIVYIWGEPMNSPPRVPIDATVPPGGTLTISVPLSAPEVPYDYQGNWLFEDDHGQRFGIGYKGRQFFWVAISVNGQGNGFGEGLGGCISGG